STLQWDSQRFEIAGRHVTDIAMRSGIAGIGDPAFNGERCRTVVPTEGEWRPRGDGGYAADTRQPIENGAIEANQFFLFFVRRLWQRQRGGHDAAWFKSWTDLLQACEAAQERSGPC